MFLSAPELAELTGISRGKDSMTCGELQAAQLRAMKIPHYRNAAGRPVIARAVIEGAAYVQSSAAGADWMPEVMSGKQRAYG
ncbi:DUF4224 domain-containing protein [Xylophilus sp. Leaf220]|uniref:DUF4224 domain-containing protein n=1 Tax=Xylophilus sp. Leaf220 TaxID=1735686 RepID=UPI002100F651|nr:DUF4224 domain-containing protein [Xylophilus sp. Leaf220]